MTAGIDKIEETMNSIVNNVSSIKTRFIGQILLKIRRLALEKIPVRFTFIQQMELEKDTWSVRKY